MERMRAPGLREDDKSVPIARTYCDFDDGICQWVRDGGDSP